MRMTRREFLGSAAACLAAPAWAQAERPGTLPPRIIYYNNFALVDGYRLFEVIPDWGSYDVVQLPRGEYHQRMDAFVDRLEAAKTAVNPAAVLFPNPERYRQELLFFARLFADLTAPAPDYDALQQAYWNHVYRIDDHLPNHVDPRPRGNTARFVRHFRDWK